jgi:hypothetical protein
MGNFIDLTGKIYGRLTVLKLNSTAGGRTMWQCECMCGGTSIVDGWNLKTFHTTSCGCKRKESNSGATHNLSSDPIYTLWNKIKERCNNPKIQCYPRYGGRGIKMCDDWLNDFTSFYSWCINNGYKVGLQIDRINNNGNYSPDNCRFVTRRVNCFNRTTNRKYLFDGKELTGLELEGISKVPPDLIARRVRKGWSVQRAISTPNRRS